MDFRESPPATPAFGPLLRRLRTAAALSQEELAERAGVSVRGVGDLERGVHQAPRLETVRLLADALQLAATDRADLLAAARPEIAASAPPFERMPLRAAVPRPLTRLIGREIAVDSLSRMLMQSDHRLVTLTGPGGVGKTRIALAVADIWADRDARSVVFVDIAPVRDPALVAVVVATALGIREGGLPTLAAQLTAALHGRAMLLILDNVEQVLDAAPFVAALLGAAPEVQVLATSREPLRLSGERVLPVEPLTLVDSGPHPGEAVALFIDRARAADPGFALTPGNAAAIAAIVGRLDGLPLAIELAAARVRSLPPDSLLTWLEQHPLRLLTGGPRDLPDRQRTIRNAIGWSHDLLSPPEQRLFRTLSVFVGGFGLDAAAAVTAALEVDEFAVFDGVASLIDKSLVRRTSDSAGAPRYAMLETIREYGLELLATSGEDITVRDAHAAWAVMLAEQADAAILGRDQRQWLTRLDAEQPNLRAALGWLEQQGDIATRLRGARALMWFWFIRGHLSEGRAWLERALADGEAAPATLRARALVAVSVLAFGQADYQATLAFAEACIAVADSIGDIHSAAAAHVQLGMVPEMQGHYALAVARFEEALALWRQTDDRFWVAITLSQLGEAVSGLRDFDRAAELHEESLAILREIGGPWATAVTLSNLGFVVFERGDTARAEHLFRECLALWWEIDDRWFIAHALAQLSAVAAAQQQFARAARLIGAVEAICHTIATQLAFSPAPAAPYERAVHMTRVQIGDAAFASACAAGRSLPLAETVRETLAATPVPPVDRCPAPTDAP